MPFAWPRAIPCPKPSLPKKTAIAALPSAAHPVPMYAAVEPGSGSVRLHVATLVEEPGIATLCRAGRPRAGVIGDLHGRARQDGPFREIA